MPRKKMNKIDERAIRNMAVYLIIIAVIYISIILIFVISLKYSQENSLFKYNTSEQSKFFMNEFNEIKILDEQEVPYYLNSLCEENCYYKIPDDNNMYYFNINKNEDEYTMIIYSKTNKLSEVNLGTNINELIVSYYNSYILYKLVYTDGVDSRDMVILLENETVNVINSLGVNEIELTEEGITYYSYACMYNENTNALRHKNIKKLNDNNSIILEQEFINYDKC